MPSEPYDITVDTHKNSPDECADAIIEILNFPEKHTAFQSLLIQYDKNKEDNK